MGRFKNSRPSVFRNILEQQYDESIKYKLYKSVKGSEDWVQRLGLLKILPVHSGCVNCICWNEKGDSILSGSDDQHLVISNAYSYKVMTDYRTSHKANIFSAKFLPCTNDTGIISCSGDGMILYSDLLRLGETHTNIFNCHIGTTYEVATIPYDPHVFLSCGEDYTVRCFDLRTKEKCMKTRCLDVCREDVIIACNRAVTALTVNTVIPYQLAIGCSDSTVRLYDRRMLTPGRVGDTAKPLMAYVAPGMDGTTYRITSLSFSPDGEDILVSYSSEHLYLFSVKNGITTTLSVEAPSEEPEVDSDSPIAPVRRLRLRGDWSDTGPEARPQNYSLPGGAIQARPTLHGTLMQRMTDVLSRMLNDPITRAALSHGGEGAFPESDQSYNSEPPAQGSSEGEDVEEEPPPAGYDLNDPNNTGPPLDPLELPLPSFTSSFSQPPPAEPQPETMDVCEQTPPPKPEPAVAEKKEDAPSTSSSSSSTPATPSTSTSRPRIDKEKLIGPLNELSNMYQGFVEKTGVEPMVNLMYSDVGSTTSCISVFVKEDGSKLKESDIADCSSSAAEGNQSPTPDDSQPEAEQSSGPDSHMATDYSGGSDHELSDNQASNPNVTDREAERNISSRLVHPIEDEMDNAINNARSSTDVYDHEAGCTKKSYFKQKYVGHRNARTMIKEANFWGDDYVISGSDCGHVFMWERKSGKLRMLLEADHHVVNCVQPHPSLPILATSGIDYDVKLWAPVHNEPAFEQEMADELMKRNAVMLEETKDTITVPASFMIRMLACLNQIRRGGRSRLQRRDSSNNSD